MKAGILSAGLTMMLMCSVNVIPPAEPTGKTFRALVSESCEKTTDGGCMVYTYCVLAFEKDSVEVSYRIKASCFVKEREASHEQTNGSRKEIYAWSLHNDSVIIHRFTEYGVLKPEGTKLLGTKKQNNTFVPLEFNEEIE